MKINNINNINNMQSNCKSSKNTKNPNFQARLVTTPMLEQYFVYKTKNPMLYRVNMQALANRLSMLAPADEGVMLTLTDSAMNSLQRGYLPQEPVAEVFLGKPLNQSQIAITSERIEFNLVDEIQALPEKITSIAKALIEKKYR